MRAFGLLSFVVVAACASSGGSSAPARPATQTMSGGGLGAISAASGGGTGAITISNEISSDVAKMPYSADAVFRILASVYDSIGIPVTALDPVRKTIGNPSYKTRMRLGKVALSKYFECGTTQIGPNADSYDVVINVTTAVAADGASASTMTTFVDAQSRPVTFNQAYNRCTSKGLLETRLADIVKARLSRP